MKDQHNVAYLVFHDAKLARPPVFIRQSLATVVAQQHPQKPGKWQITVEMEMPGGGKMPPVTQEVCVTEEDLADPSKAAMTDPKSGCKVSDYKTKGSTATYNIDCPAQQMKGKGTMTFAGETLTGDVKLSMGGQEIATKYTGKWLGTCSK
jgi:hypothetical protein